MNPAGGGLRGQKNLGKVCKIEQISLALSRDVLTKCDLLARPGEIM